MGSCQTVPVNESADPRRVGTEPDGVNFIAVSLSCWPPPRRHYASYVSVHHESTIGPQARPDFYMANPIKDGRARGHYPR
jgi:hypothetical protein